MLEWCSPERFVRHPYARKSLDEESLVSALFEKKILLISHASDRNLSKRCEGIIFVTQSDTGANWYLEQFLAAEVCRVGGGQLFVNPLFAGSTWRKQRRERSRIDVAGERCVEKHR